MKKRSLFVLITAIAIAMFFNILTGCGGSDSSGLSINDIPPYPNAIEDESMGGSSPGGFISGNLLQFTTTDSYDDVMAFYQGALKSYNPQVLSQPSELGRQSAISMPQKKKMISVSIQEFTEEGTVNITFMEVGS